MIRSSSGAKRIAFAFRRFHVETRSKEAVMAISWIDKLILIFQPEDSSRLQNLDAFYTAAFRPVDRKPPLSVKALFWTVIAILVGLSIGQL
jgi:hypothetical protein